MTVEGREAQPCSFEVELHLPGGVVNVFEAFDDGTHSRRARRAERDEPGIESPAGVGRIGRDAGEVGSQVVVGVAGPQDIMSTTLRILR